MISAKDGSIYDRALVDPDRNNFGPRLGLAYTLATETVVRGGWGLSYVHMNRIGSANLLPINGPQVVRAVVVQSDTSAATFRPTEQGYPTGMTDPAAFKPLAANISYIPRDFHSSPVQSWYVSLQHEFEPRMLIDVVLRRQPRRRSAAPRKLQPGVAEQRGGNDSPSEPSPDLRLRGYHLRLQRRQIAL